MHVLDLAPRANNDQASRPLIRAIGVSPELLLVLTTLLGSCSTLTLQVFLDHS